MSTATLDSMPLASQLGTSQLMFPWAVSQADEAATIVAERVALPTRTNHVTSEFTASPSVVEPVATSLHEALDGDRIGRPFKMGSVMFRLLKSYGISDEEIAAGVAAYQAKRALSGTAQAVR